MEDTIQLTAVPSKIMNKINHLHNIRKLFKGMHMNIRNMGKNIDEFKSMIKETKIEYDIIGLTECWSTEEEARIFNKEIDNYINVHSQKKFNQNGGISLYINQKYDWQIIEENKIQEAESLVVEIKDKKDNKQNFVIILIYRSPGRKEELFIKSLRDKVTDKFYSKRSVIIMGDINIDVKTENKTGKELIEKMAEKGYTQEIKDPTRETRSTSTVIDHIYTNIPSIKKIAGTIITNITDHYGTHINILKEKSHRPIKTDDYKDKVVKMVNYKKISEEIKVKDFEDIRRETDPSKKVEKLQEEILKIVLKNTTEKRKANHYNRKGNEWITTEIMKKIRKRDKKTI